MKMIQFSAISQQPGQLPSALLGLDDEGKVWFGRLQYGGTGRDQPHAAQDAGLVAVTWRIVEHRGA